MRHTDNEKLTELSAALDAVNRGESPDSQDEDIRELAAVAQLLRRSGPPPAVVAGLADTLGAELAAKKRRRRLWLTSGAAGTAAAALLVFALNTGPAVPSKPPMTVPPTGSVVIQTVPQPAPQTAPQTAPETAKAGDEAQPAKPPVPSAREAAPAPAAREAAPAPEKAPAPDRPAAVAAENYQAQKRTMLAKAPEKAMDQATNEAAPAALVWPGHQPDSVAYDKNTDAVRQVYGSGDGRIVITRRPAGGAAETVRNEAAKAGGTTEKTNRVTLTVGGYVVTVEGNQSIEELQKIARSLE